MHKTLSYSEIKSMIESGSKSITVHYQPQYCLKTGLLTGAEALVRLVGKKGEIYSPALFIDKVENDKSLSELMGLEVITQVIQSGVKYREKKGKNLTMSVNFGVHQLSETAIITEVLDRLLDSGIPPKFFKVEVTEAAASHQLSKVKRVLEGLKLGGCSIAIDDFGSGYSTFAYLRILPVDTVKFDKSLADLVPMSSPDVDLCKGLVRLSEELGIEVVAEGVETQEQHEFFKKISADVGQGFLYSRPVEFDKILEEEKASHVA